MASLVGVQVFGPAVFAILHRVRHDGMPIPEATDEIVRLAQETMSDSKEDR